uniref:ZZ-type domain-containing protein n=1 Tax=Corethron hystrix TaxID=216773 RepID=A0A7S1BY67_9STRA|mmetsp:Transcript_5341/g.10962  ORF Transcript_5341/g.10962 Transcript_5341/m.10962 type:complete len:580 (+) Transcript_5341:122-1861(+)
MNKGDQDVHDHIVVKLTINYDTVRHICVQRIKRDPGADSLDNVEFNKLKRISIGYLPGIYEMTDFNSFVNNEEMEESMVHSSDKKELKSAAIPYQDYDVTITYFDEDGDEITISSDIELTEALEKVRRLNGTLSTCYLYAYAAVSKNVKCPFDGHIFRSIRMIHLKRRAAQRARTDARKTHEVTEYDQDQKKNSLVKITAMFDSPLVHKLSSAVDATVEACGDAIKKTAPKAMSACKFFNLPKISRNGDFDPEFVHIRHTCDNCGVSPIIGFRYHAVDLVNFDVCQICKENYDIDETNSIIFRQAQRNSDRNFVPQSILEEMIFSEDEKHIAKAIEQSIVTLTEENVKRKNEVSQKEIAEVTNEMTSLLSNKNIDNNKEAKNKHHNIAGGLKDIDQARLKIGIACKKHLHICDQILASNNNPSDSEGDTFSESHFSHESQVSFGGRKSDEKNAEILMEKQTISIENRNYIACENILEEVSPSCEQYSKNIHVEQLQSSAVFRHAEDADYREHDSNIEGKNSTSSTMVLNEVAKEKNVDEDWDILEDREFPSDELACATRLMGSSLFKNDLGNSEQLAAD